MSKKRENQVSISRKEFIATVFTGLAATAISASPLNLLMNPANKFKGIAFDAFPIFDPRPVFKLAESIYAEKGAELANIWRTKQFEYSWLRTAAGQYKNFWHVTEDALVYAANKTGVTLTPENKKQLLDQYLTLPVWPDVLPALQILKEKGIKLSFLSNMTNEMLTSCIKYNKIENFFDAIISTDNAKTYKPNRFAYQLGVDALQFKKEEILFVAYAGWDASGAKWFGYPTFWVNRLGTPTEVLDTTPDAIGKSMADLIGFVTK